MDTLWALRFKLACPDHSLTFINRTVQVLAVWSSSLTERELLSVGIVNFRPLNLLVLEILKIGVEHCWTSTAGGETS